MEILLVDDSFGDVRLTIEAFRTTRTAVHISAVSDGEEAVAFLRKEGEFAESPTPDMILLDLNMPRKSGLEVLEEIKSDPVLGSIPVVVLTTSSATEDVEESYRLHANSYIRKPSDLKGFFDLVRRVDEYWLQAVKLPSKGSR